MRIRLPLIIATLMLGCSPTSKTTERLQGEWIGKQVWLWEKTLYSDSAKTLSDQLGETSISMETVQDSLEFRFSDDSAWITTNQTKMGFSLTIDESNQELFFLNLNRVFGVKIIKMTTDSLVLEDPFKPINISYETGQIIGSQAKIVGNQYVLIKK